MFIFINDAVKYFFRFVQSVPHLIFDLRVRDPKLNNTEVQDVIYYLKSKIHTPLINIYIQY